VLKLNRGIADYKLVCGLFFAFLYLSAPYYVDLKGVCQYSKHIFFNFFDKALKPNLCGLLKEPNFLWHGEAVPQKIWLLILLRVPN
jgi:hypothetical protein